MSEEEKKAIEKLTNGEFVKITIQELIRKMKKEGVERFVITRSEYIDIILNLIKRLQKENEELKEYIMLAPNLDEMTAIKYRNIQKEAYIRGRAEEQKKAEQIIYENYIPVQKVKDKIEELNQKIENEENEKVIIWLHKQRRVLQELLEGRK